MFLVGSSQCVSVHISVGLWLSSELFCLPLQRLFALWCVCIALLRVLVLLVLFVALLLFVAPQFPILSIERSVVYHCMVV